MDEEEEESIEALHSHLKRKLKGIQDNPAAWPFLKPVSRKEAPHYHEIIKDPIGYDLPPTQSAQFPLIDWACFASLLQISKRWRNG